MKDLKFGWKPDLPDQRDFQYKAAPLKTLPPIIDLRKNCPPVYDQGSLGSCTANAIAAAVQFNQMKKRDPDTFMPSRLFIYYNERLMEGTVKYDSGAMIRDGIKSVNKQGVCKETTVPYITTRFTIKPPINAYKEAIKYRTLVYSAVSQDITSVKECLASGDVFVFGFAVYSSFVTPIVANTGIMPVPKYRETLLGGHAVTCVGYDDTKQWLICRNSWGIGWGDKGYFYMPYAFFFTNQTTDFWSIKDVMI